MIDEPSFTLLDIGGGKGNGKSFRYHHGDKLRGVTVVDPDISPLYKTLFRGYPVREFKMTWDEFRIKGYCPPFNSHIVNCTFALTKMSFKESHDIINYMKKGKYILIVPRFNDDSPVEFSDHTEVRRDLSEDPFSSKLIMEITSPSGERVTHVDVTDIKWDESQTLEISPILSQYYDITDEDIDNFFRLFNLYYKL